MQERAGNRGRADGVVEGLGCDYRVREKLCRNSLETLAHFLPPPERYMCWLQDMLEEQRDGAPADAEPSATPPPVPPSPPPLTGAAADDVAAATDPCDGEGDAVDGVDGTRLPLPPSAAEAVAVVLAGATAATRADPGVWLREYKAASVHGRGWPGGGGGHLPPRPGDRCRARGQPPPPPPPPSPPPTQVLGDIRRAQEGSVGDSFPTISSVGPNGAIIHYQPTEGSDSAITLAEMYLCDTGGQYLGEFGMGRFHGVHP